MMARDSVMVPVMLATVAVLLVPLAAAFSDTMVATAFVTVEATDITT